MIWLASFIRGFGAKIPDAVGSLTFKDDNYKAVCDCSSELDLESQDQEFCDPQVSELYWKHGPKIDVGILKNKYGIVTDLRLSSILESPVFCTDGRNFEEAFYYPGGELGIILVQLAALKRINADIASDVSTLQSLITHVSSSLRALSDNPDRTMYFCTDSRAAASLDLGENYSRPDIDDKKKLLTLKRIRAAPSMGNFWWKALLSDPNQHSFSHHPSLPADFVEAVHALMWNRTHDNEESVSEVIATVTGGKDREPSAFVEVQMPPSCASKGQAFVLDEGSAALWHSQALLPLREAIGKSILEYYRLEGDIVAREAELSPMIASSVVSSFAPSICQLVFV